MDIDKFVDLAFEKLVLEKYLKNMKDGKITPEYCLELISRAAEAEAVNDILQQEIDGLKKTIAQLYDELSQFKAANAI
jgi:predicted ATP-dependent Lon-type protease